MKPLLNTSQLGVLTAMADTFVAPLTTNEEMEALKETASHYSDSENTIAEYAQYAGSKEISSTLLWISRLAPEKQTQFRLLLSMLSTRAGTFILTGHIRRLFTELTRQERENVLFGWRDARLPLFNTLFKAVKSCLMHSIYGNPECLAYKAIGNYECEADHDEGCSTSNVNSGAYPYVLPKRATMLKEAPSSKTFDVIIVGSGAGGGVCAAQLAKAGFSVLVIEKGKYYHESDMVHNERAGLHNLFEQSATLMSDDGNSQIVAGSTWGGGTTVNFSACMKLPFSVREEWANEFGLDHFISPEFANDLNYVYDRIGATTNGVKHNRPNQLLIEGCGKLGYPIAEVAQNSGGRSHDCGFCFYGCKQGIKNGTMNTWLRDAEKHGAQFLDCTKVTRILIENNKAVGIGCIRQNNNNNNSNNSDDSKSTSFHHEQIRAKRVVVAGGAVSTPGLLHRSGLKNRHIGRNLRIHPLVYVYGIFDTPVEMYKGTILTAVSDTTGDGTGYGVKLEIPSQHPASFFAISPWRGSLAHKQLAMKFSHIMTIVVIARDKDSKGRVYDNERSEPCIDFQLSLHDRQSIEKGLDQAIHILCAAGAREIYTTQLGVEPFVFSAQEQYRIDNPRFKDWKEKVSAFGLPGNGISGIFSGHQMGTCRLGSNPNVSVTQPTGETWEVEDLYVSDASLFPTASGVNPMVTIETIAMHVASNIIEKEKII